MSSSPWPMYLQKLRMVASMANLIDRGRSKSAVVALGCAAFLGIGTGCGGHGSYSPPPVILSVSLSNSTIHVPPNGVPVYVQVTIMAPTETATFSILGLPGGMTETYKESESNPSGLLTLVAAPGTTPGTFKPTITVGSSGQTASVAFTLVIPAPSS